MLSSIPNFTKGKSFKELPTSSLALGRMSRSEAWSAQVLRVLQSSLPSGLSVAGGE